MWDFPLQQLAERFHDRKPTEEQLAGVVAWTEMTRLPWDALDMLVRDATVSIECPFCETEQDVPLLTEAKTGFCDVNFAQPCQSPAHACSAAEARGRTITREVLGIKRLLDDLALQPTCLPETDPGWSEAKRREVEAKVVRRLVGGILSLTKERDAWSTRPSAYSIVSATLVQKEAARALQKILHLLSAYTTPHAFSSDIALAANRLSEFTNSLASLGWLERSWFDSLAAETFLGQSVERYTKTLEIAAKATKDSPLVVPLDTDLVWHTHLLCPSRYRLDVYNTAGRFIDHHDAIEETLACDAFARLAKLYKTCWDRYVHYKAYRPCQVDRLLVDSVGTSGSQMLHLGPRPLG
ncbi:hypothetical protein JCM10908_003567 [Rhodotorula pacifica]|uniref:uncharacterized protein n=1 Tax=Rhodotorula pacifica TaxID=1495444 RepID=UPI00316F12FB